MNKKLQRELYGPSWAEVILGAVLSLLLGAVLAAGYLMLKPVTTVKDMPKEPAAGMVYYIEGSRNSANARQAAAKQKTFVEGGSVVLNEEELNVLMAPPPKPAVAEGDTPAPDAKMINAGALNFRIRASAMQIGVPLHLNIQGLELDVIVQTRGGFVKRGDAFAFVPDEFYVGSCPLQRLPLVEGLITKRLMAGVEVPDEVTQAWKDLSSVVLEGSTLRLAAQ